MITPSAMFAPTKRGMGAQPPNKRTRLAASGGFPWKTAVFSRRDGPAVLSEAKNDVILRARPQTILRPKDLVTPELFLGRRGAGEVVCTAPKN